LDLTVMLVFPGLDQQTNYIHSSGTEGAGNRPCFSGVEISRPGACFTASAVLPVRLPEPCS
jgi:hypothetical protein